MDRNEPARSHDDRDSERRGAESQTVVGARLHLAATRTRMSGTIAELEQQMSDRIDDVKQSVNVGALVRRHPWAALTAALVAGVALGTTGADRRAARAARDAAKRAPELARRGAVSAAGATASGVSQLASAAVGRIRGKPDDRSIVGDAQGSGGLAAKATGALGAQVRELREEASRGVEELASSMLPRDAKTSRLVQGDE